MIPAYLKFSVTVFLMMLLFSTIKASASHNGPRHSILERRDSWASFVDLWKDQTNNRGNRLIDIEVVKDGNKLWYTGIFVPGSGGHALYQFSTFASFVDKFSELHADGYALMDFDILTVDGTTLHTGVWRKGNKGQYLYCYNNWNDFKTKWQDLSGKNYRLFDVDFERLLTVEGNYKPNRPLKLTERFCGVWKPATGGHYLANTNWQKFTNLWKDLGKKGVKLRDVGMYFKDNSIVYVGAFVAGNTKSALYRYDSYQSIHNRWADLDSKGYRMTDIEALHIDGKTYYTGVWAK